MPEPTEERLSGPILPLPALERTLANGLRIIVVNTGFPNLVSLQIPVQTGSRNEVEPGKSGFAHFFEHMMFRGTERYPAEVYQQVITRAGARQNAYTTDDYTNYHITCPQEDLEKVLEIEADRFMNLAYGEDEFRTEARAVLGEYNKNSADPLNKLIEVQRDNAYSTHTYKHTTMGFIRDIEEMPEQFEYSRTFFERWYRPEYTTVILAGDLDLEEAAALVEKHWGGWAHGGGEAEAIPREPAATRPVVAHVQWASPTLPWVSIGFHGPAFSESTPEFAALDVLLDLTFGETSELYQRLVEREQVVDELFPYLPPSQDPGLFTVFARVTDSARVAYVRDQLAEAFAALPGGAVDPGRLAEAKSHARYAFLRTLDNSEAVAATLARFVRFRRSLETLNNFYALYERLTTGDLNDVARRYIAESNMVVATLASEALPASMAASPALRSASVPGAAAAVPIVRISSPSPLTRFKLLFETGSAFDPPGKEGLAALAASMIAEAGSERMRIDEINRALFPIAASFTVQVDREMTTFTGVAHRDTLEQFAAVVLPQLSAPGFREDDFARLKTSQTNALLQDLRANNEEELGKERLQEILFAGTAYGHTSLGTAASLAGLTLDDVRTFVAGNYARSRLVVGLTGDVPDSFVGTLTAQLAKLPAGETPPKIDLASRETRGINVEIIQKETRAVAISLGHRIPVTRSHPDFAALWLVRSWLGEHRASNGRLYNRIREARGINYGDYAYIEAFPHGMYQFFPQPNLARRAQIFEIWIRPAPPEQAVFALKTALFELRTLVSNGLSEEDFATTRQYLNKSVFVMTKTQDQQLGYALDSRWYGLPEFTSWMRGELESLTLGRVNAAIRAHLSGDNLSVVVVASDAKALKAELTSGAFSPISYDGSRPPELLAEDQLIGALALAISPDRVTIRPVEEVFA